ncbi:MAG: SDR family NAD(P)-dependent oxidoreductase [Mangrovibacterium sp.]
MIENSKVLVTGGAGFIGSNLVDRLLAQNNQVVCLDNFSTGKLENLEKALNNPEFILIEGDIRNYDDCRKAVAGCTCVLHQAALGSVPRSIADPVTSADVNIGGFVKMMFAAKDEGVGRFVYASSSSVYGDHSGLPKVEHQIGKALSPYAVTKYADELLAANFSAMYGIETVGLRYFNVFGPRQDPSGAYAAVVPKFINSIINHENLQVFGDGTFSRDFTYIENVLQAIQLAASAPSSMINERQQTYYKRSQELCVPGVSDTIAEVFNTAVGQYTTIAELADTLKQILARFDHTLAHVDVTYRPARPGDVPHSMASCEKSQAILGYRPTHTISQGLEETCKWYWQRAYLNVRQ